MSKKTWIFFIYLSILAPDLSTSAPSESKGKEDTLYQALTHKCPHLEETELKENLKDIFSTKCLNWTAINAANYSQSQYKNDAQCVLLYESLISFCTNLGAQVAQFRGLLPKAPFDNYTIEEICLGNKSIAMLKSLEHNITNIVEPVFCTLMCGELEAGKAVVSDLCKVAYYFGTFDIDKFKHNFHLLHPGVPNVELQAKPEASNNNNGTSKKEDQKETITKVTKPQQTVKDNLVVSQANNIAQIVPEKKPEVAAAPAILNNNNKSEKKVSEDNNKNLEDNKTSSEGKILVENGSVGEEENVPDVDQQQEESPNNKGKQAEVPPEKVNSGEINDKFQNGEVEEEDQDLNDEDEEVDTKKEPVMPSETVKQTPTKKVKPITDPDEPVSNYENGPDEDANGESYFFSYFTVIMCLVIVGYVGYHNKQKILALILEGKRGKRNCRAPRRPNSANYHKLDSNLEEAMSSTSTKNASNVIY